MPENDPIRLRALRVLDQSIATIAGITSITGGRNTPLTVEHRTAVWALCSRLQELPAWLEGTHCLEELGPLSQIIWAELTLCRLQALLRPDGRRSGQKHQMEIEPVDAFSTPVAVAQSGFVGDLADAEGSVAINPEPTSPGAATAPRSGGSQPGAPRKRGRPRRTQAGAVDAFTPPASAQPKVVPDPANTWQAEANGLDSDPAISASAIGDDDVPLNAPRKRGRPRRTSAAASVDVSLKGARASKKPRRGRSTLPIRGRSS